jgi:hypothetical protein
MFVLKGSEFNKKYANKKFYKLTKSNEIHHGYKFCDGLNVDTLQIGLIDDFQIEGLYFCEEKYVKNWLTYTDDLIYIRKVSIPDDAIVCIEKYELKTDKFILGSRQLISVFLAK